MHPRARRAISVALSIALHALLLLEVWSWTVARPMLPEPANLPVRILEDRPPARQPRVAKPQPKPAQPPPQVAKVEPPKVEAPPPEPPPQQQPEKKLPLPEQIVSPPDAGKEQAPSDTRFKSDRDVTVEKQQVKRGEPLPGESGAREAAPAPPAKPPARPPAKPAPPRPQPGGGGGQRRQPPPRVAALPSLDRLMPGALELAQGGYGQPAPDAPAPREQRAQRSLGGGGNDGLFIPVGPTGTLDYLPEVREGDITLLNTKAEVFAPFVRRVAVRVFQNFLIALKKDITVTGLQTQESVEAEAVMDPRGEMIGFTVTRRSPRITLGIDRRLQQAANVAFFDRNPPPGARWEDGNYHFVFVADIEAAPSPRGQMYAVQLGTGLK